MATMIPLRRMMLATAVVAALAFAVFFNMYRGERTTAHVEMPSACDNLVLATQDPALAQPPVTNLLAAPASDSDTLRALEESCAATRTPH